MFVQWNFQICFDFMMKYISSTKRTNTKIILHMFVIELFRNNEAQN